nr:Hpt domain-containing protein [Lachnospiraceae bacterium]
MDVSQYLGIFLDESQEHIQALNDNLLTLEQDPENEDSINEIFRAAHSLKGMAGTMGYKRLQKLTHITEDVFSAIRSGQMKVTSAMIDVLFQALDGIQGYVDTIRDTTEEGDDDNEAITTELKNFLEGGGEKAPEPKKADEKEAPAAEAAADSDGGDKALYRKVVLEDAQKDVMKDAVVAGNHVYAFTVYVQESCLLKAARAFLVFKAIEEIGEVVVSDPPTQDIEDEKFDFHFNIFVITSEPFDKVQSAIKAVSEIEDAIGEEYDEAKIDADVKAEASSQAAEPEKPAEVHQEVAEKPEKAPEKETPAPAAKAAPSGGKKPAAKPVTSRTIRVDIEKLDVLMNLVSELIIAKNSLVSAASGNNNMKENMAINEQIDYLESVTTNLHESVMKVRMVPIESAVQKFPRMIRDLEKKLGKKMNLTISGEET